MFVLALQASCTLLRVLANHVKISWINPHHKLWISMDFKKQVFVEKASYSYNMFASFILLKAKFKPLII